MSDDQPWPFNKPAILVWVRDKYPKLSHLEQNVMVDAIYNWFYNGGFGE